MKSAPLLLVLCTLLCSCIMTRTDAVHLQEEMLLRIEQEQAQHALENARLARRIEHLQRELEILRQTQQMEHESLTDSVGQEVESLQQSLVRAESQLTQTRRTVHDILLGRLGGKADPKSKAPEIGGQAIPDDPEQHIRLGERFLANGHYGDAVETFALFLKRYDDPERSERAYFGIGEAHFHQAKNSSNGERPLGYRRSIVGYQRLLAAHPRSKQADIALYRIGLAFEALGHSEDARIFFEELVNRFPGSTLRDKARQKLRAKTSKSNQPPR